jgi:Protein of unknown function (DUF3606)
MIIGGKAPALNRSYIAMDDEFEVKYWIKHLKVSHEELKNAVEKVGNSAAAVRKQLATSGKTAP